MSGPAHNLAAERTFLHDLSNPLAIGVGNLNLAVTALEEVAKAAASAAPISAAQMVLSRCQKAAAALERVVALIEERRRWLKANVTPAVGG